MITKFLEDISNRNEQVPKPIRPSAKITYLKRKRNENYPWTADHARDPVVSDEVKENAQGEIGEGAVAQENQGCLLHQDDVADVITKRAKSLNTPKGCQKTIVDFFMPKIDGMAGRIPPYSAGKRARTSDAIEETPTQMTHPKNDIDPDPQDGFAIELLSRPSQLLTRCLLRKGMYIPRFNKCDSAATTGSSTPQPKSKPIKWEQLFLELGQRNFGPFTCPECQMSYSRGTKDDDAVHERHHRAVVGGVDYPGYKNEIVVRRYPEGDGRVVLITNASSLFEKKKAQEVLEVVNVELGSPNFDETSLERYRLYLYVTGSRKKVVGCVATEHISRTHIVSAITADEGHTGDDADQLPVLRRIQHVEATCGINRIWVSKYHRRKGVATKLLDVVRSSFVYGCVIAPSALAFSQPTGDGKAFASRYCGTKTFLVYTEEIDSRNFPSTNEPSI